MKLRKGNTVDKIGDMIKYYMPPEEVEKIKHQLRQFGRELVTDTLHLNLTPQQIQDKYGFKP